MELCVDTQASERDCHYFKDKVYFTHCVEWNKLDSILKEGILRPIQGSEFATRIVENYTPNLEKSSGSELRAIVNQANQFLQGESLEEGSLFLQFYQRESKIFLGFATRESISDITALQVNQMWGTYRAMLVYTADLLEGRGDYVLSVGQANSEFDPEQDALPGEGEKFEQLISKCYPREQYYLNSEVKFKNSIPNTKISFIYARAQDQEEFLAKYSDRIIATSGNTWKIQINEFSSQFVPLVFIPFVHASD